MEYQAIWIQFFSSLVVTFHQWDKHLTKWYQPESGYSLKAEKAIKIWFGVFFCDTIIQIKQTGNAMEKWIQMILDFGWEICFYNTFEYAIENFNNHHRYQYMWELFSLSFSVNDKNFIAKIAGYDILYWYRLNRSVLEKVLLFSIHLIRIQVRFWA